MFGPHTEALIAELERERERRLWDEYQRGFRALMLSTSLEVYRALMAGEHVPLNRLDIRWVRRFGLKRIAA
jgi:hypothetical protein